MKSQQLYSSASNRNSFGLIVFALLIMLNAGCALAQTNRSSAKPIAQQKSENPLVGRWQSDEATVEIRSNGTLTINGEEFAYKVRNSVIVVTGEDGSMNFPFELNGDRLVVEVEGREVVYTRVKSGAKIIQPKRDAAAEFCPSLSANGVIRRTSTAAAETRECQIVVLRFTKTALMNITPKLRQAAQTVRPLRRKAIRDAGAPQRRQSPQFPIRRAKSFTPSKNAIIRKPATRC